MLEGALRELEAQLARMTAPQRADVTLGFKLIFDGLGKLGPIGLSGKVGNKLLGAIVMAAARQQSPASFFRDAAGVAAKVGPHVKLLVSTLAPAAG